MYIHYGNLIVFMMPIELCGWLGIMAYLRLAETAEQDTGSTQIFYFYDANINHGVPNVAIIYFLTPFCLQ